MQVFNSPAIWLKDFPLIKDDMNKYDRGHAVIVGASILGGSTGASKLAALSALRSGAGLVSIASNYETVAIYAASMTSVIVKIIHNKDELLQLIKDQKIKAVLIGPGNEVNIELQNNILEALALKKNMVIDAAGLTVFQNNPNKLFLAINSDIVLTPHDGEFKRLFE